MTGLKIKRKKKENSDFHCTEAQSTEFISKQPFFVVNFFVTLVQIECPSLRSVHDQGCHFLAIANKDSPVTSPRNFI